MRVGLIWLAAILLLAAGLRWFRIDAQSLWYDEGISAHQLTRSYADIVRATALDTHPPLYYWTLKAWGETVGASELGLRSLSALWGVVCVALTWLVGRRLFGTLVATLAGLLLAIAPLAVYYSQEVRMYTQVTALGMLAAYAFVSRRYWLYAVAAAATLYTQYLGAAFLVAIGVHALATFRTRSRRDWALFVGSNAAAAIAFLPWLPTFIDQQSHGLNVTPRTASRLALDTLTAYGGGIARGDLLLYGGVALVALAVLGTFWAVRDRCLRQPAAMALLLWLMPLGLVLGLGLRNGLFEVRYLLLGMPGLVLLSALGIVKLTHWPVLAPIATAALAVPAVSGLQSQYFDPALARDDYRSVVADILRDARPDDAILLTAPNQTEVFSYYYRGPLPTFGLPLQRPPEARDTLQRLDDFKQHYGRVWYVDWASREADPQGLISTWLAENGFPASHGWYGGVQLSLVALGGADASTERVDLALDNGLNLDAYRVGTRSLKAGDTLALTLVWRAPGGPTAQRWKVFTHLLDGSSKVVAQRDAEPADALKPTTTWAPGEQVQDRYGIAVPSDLAPGSYVLEIGMYAGEQRAHFPDGSNHLVLADIQVTRQ